VSLERIPEPFERIGKTSRVHLDLYTNDQEGEVERLIEIRATRCPQDYHPDDDFIVLEDPDGNRFCVVQAPVGVRRFSKVYKARSKTKYPTI
jgi:hypothetical protein